jgi:hypothetical protein
MSPVLDMMHDYYLTHCLVRRGTITPGRARAGPVSDSSWSDLPSDTEETFLMTAEVVEDYHRDKLRRLMEERRLERFRALEEEDMLMLIAGERMMKRVCYLFFLRSVNWS